MSKKNSLLKSAGEKNSIIVELQSDIDNLRKSLKVGLNNHLNAIQFNLENLNKESKRINTRISSIPTKEREFLDIARQQEIIATLYSYLLKKREETAISLAVTVNNAKIIDSAYGSDIPIAPKKKIIVLGAIILGLIIPFIIIYLRDLLDTKVHTKKDIEDLTSVPFIGDVPHNETNQKIVVNSDARSSTAEAFRLIRTNLDFMLSNKKSEGGKTIFITSTTSEKVNLSSLLIWLLL